MTMFGADGVSVGLRGGLGNQLFIFGAGLSKSRELDVPLYVFWDPPVGELASRDCLVDKMFNGIPGVQFFTDSSSRSVLLRRRLHIIRNRGWVQGLAHDVPGTWSQIRPGSFLVGYFQALDFVKNSAELMKNHLRQKGFFNVLQKNWPLFQEEDVLFHIRRGDYTDSTVQKSHGLLSREYFERADRSLLELGAGGRRFVISDDEDYIRSIAPRHGWISIRTESSNPWENLVAMSQAPHLVISNSTFSWWSGWFGDQAQTATVWAPDVWKVSQPGATDRILPKHWRRLQGLFAD